MTSSGVIYRNQSSTVFLLDIPRTIEDAQGGDAGGGGSSSSNSISSNNSAPKRILSSEPLRQPFKTPEPRSERARQKCLDAHAALHEEYASAIQLALDEVHQQRTGDWCLDRRVAPEPASRKRTAAEAELGRSPVKELGLSLGECVTVNETNETDQREAGSIYQIKKLQDTGSDKHLRSQRDHGSGNSSRRLGLAVQPSQGLRAHLPDDFLKAVSSSTDKAGAHRPAISYERGSTPPDSTTASCSFEVPADDVQLPTGVFLQNSGIQSLQAQVSLGESYRFVIPPMSRALLSTCDNSASLRIALRGAYPSRGSPALERRRLDLILLDPPWPNRSARRRGSYHIQYNLQGAKTLLYSMDLDIHLATGSFVAVWITNKTNVRDLVLGHDGYGHGGWFGSLGVELVEEWIWVKTTSSGEPVSSLQSQWRKPYEVLLVGRRGGNLWYAPKDGQPRQVKRRIIIAVPDLHSRKPCLKALFDDLLFEHRSYRALEVFARYMVGGWWSWGDEAIRYNWEGDWS